MVSSDNPAKGSRSDWRAATLLRVALAIGILAHLAGFALFRVVDAVTPVNIQQTPFIRFENFTARNRDRFFEEQAMLLDSKPLFLPTTWNYAARVRTETPTTLPPSIPFEPFAETIHLRQVDFFGTRPSEPPVNTSQLIVDLIMDRNDVLANIAPSVAPDPPLPERLAFIRLQKLDGPELVIERIIRPNGEKVPVNGQLWEPVELLLQIDAGGKVDNPVKISSSGSEESDGHIIEWTTAPETLRNVPPGYYRVTVGP